MHDSYAEIKEKVNSAYCPEKVVGGNPILNYVDLLILDDPEARIEIERSPKFGGTLEIDGYKELVNVYSSGKLHPLDLKKFVAEKLEERIKPVREHFEKDGHARALYETVKGYKITR
jgi:tyrosyl-tRNA synthetase